MVIHVTTHIFYIFMYMLIHTVLSVDFFIDEGLWKRVYNSCTLCVLKDKDRGQERGCTHKTRFKPPVVHHFY